MGDCILKVVLGKRAGRAAFVSKAMGGDVLSRKKFQWLRILAIPLLPLTKHQTRDEML